MKYSTQIHPVSYLKSHTAEIIKTITADQEPLVITQNGEAKLVIMDVRSYEKYEETLALLKIIALGKKQIQDKKFRTMQSVLNDLEKD